MSEQTFPAEGLDEDRRPYAPASNVLSVIERVRRINLPGVIDADFLRLADVPEGTLGRVAFSLRFLALIDGGGRPTDQLRAIAKATEEEYRELLAATVRSAYADDFARVDPATEPQGKIVSAFQRYEPRSQTTRMVMHFLGLAKAAGIPVIDAPRERGTQKAPRVAARSGVARSQGKATTPRAFASPTARPTPVESGASLLFGVTVEDIAALPEADFTSVWEALGKVARARARAAARPAEPVAEENAEE